MIALYGEWGSGKSCVIDTFEKGLKEEYETIVFHAWKYEKDNNISLSLLDFIMDKFGYIFKENDDLIKNLKLASKTLFTFGKNILLNSSVSFLGMNLNLGAAGTDTIDELKNNDERRSYYTEIEAFEEAFLKVVLKINQTIEKTVLIVIDDLDRCSPDNILDLLTSIKHFFKSEYTVYLSAIDKKAVEQVIYMNYGEYIKTDEYLDKIFDFSFNMPIVYDIDNITHNFICKLADRGFVVNKELEEDIIDFLNVSDISNPRKIKKIFNKLLYLVDLNRIVGMSGRYFTIDKALNDSSLSFLTLLYMIVLFEYERDLYKNIINKTKKLEDLRNSIDWGENGINVVKQKNIQGYAYINNLEDYAKDYTISHRDYVNYFDEELNNKMDNPSINTRNKLIYYLLMLSPKDMDVIRLPSSTSSGKRGLESSLNNFIRRFKTTNMKYCYEYLEFAAMKLKKSQDSKVDMNSILEVSKLFF